MCQYFLEKSYMKTPFIAAVLGILDYTKNFGRPIPNPHKKFVKNIIILY